MVGFKCLWSIIQNQMNRIGKRTTKRSVNMKMLGGTGTKGSVNFSIPQESVGISTPLGHAPISWSADTDTPKIFVKSSRTKEIVLVNDFLPLDWF